MKTIHDFLKSTRIVEFIDSTSNPMFKDFNGALQMLMPEVELLPIRSISADVFSLKFREVRYIVWDESYVDFILRFAFILLENKPISLTPQATGIGFHIMGDLLFDEGLYLDAWITATIGNIKIEQTRSLNIKEREYPIHIHKSMLSFLFFHEMGHLLCDYQNDMYRSLRVIIENQVKIYTLYLATLSRREKQRVLSDHSIIFADFNEELLDDYILDIDDNLIQEIIADTFAAGHVFKSFVDSGSHAIDISEALLALRIGMEVVREIRIATRLVAVEKREHPVQSETELMRSFVLRHTLFWLSVDSALSTDERGRIGEEFITKHIHLLAQKAKIYNGIARNLVDFGIGEARNYRLKINYRQSVHLLPSDMDTQYMHSYLRLRGWESGEDFSPGFTLDSLPHITRMTTLAFMEALNEFKNRFEEIENEKAKQNPNYKKKDWTDKFIFPGKKKKWVDRVNIFKFLKKLWSKFFLLYIH